MVHLNAGWALELNDLVSMHAPALIGQHTATCPSVVSCIVSYMRFGDRWNINMMLPTYVSMIGPLAGLPGNGVHAELTVLHLIIQVLACMYAARPRAHGNFLLLKLYPLVPR